MRRWSFAPFVCSLALVVACSPPAQEDKKNTVRYQGEKFEVITPASNFDASDTRSYARKEDGERIEQLMRAAPIAQSFANLTEVLAALDQVAFPGYGRGLMPQQNSADPQEKSHIILAGLEIPNRYKSRYLAFKSRADGGYDLVDDFVLEPKPAPPAPPAPPPPKLAEGEEPPPPPPEPEPIPVVVSSLRFQGAKIRYLDALGQVVREK